MTRGRLRTGSYQRGYRIITLSEDDPLIEMVTRSKSSKYVRQVREHRYIVAQSLGRPLFPNEEVHHKNGIKDDNRLENLELWSTSQPKGKRAQDLIEWAREIINIYGEQFPN